MSREALIAELSPAEKLMNAKLEELRAQEAEVNRARAPLEEELRGITAEILALREKEDYVSRKIDAILGGERWLALKRDIARLEKELFSPEAVARRQLGV